MLKRTAINNTRSAIAALRRRIAAEPIPRAKREWGGANVIIVTSSRGGRYREVVTPHALEASWLFERLRDAFSGVIDGCSKFELYGRLELAANRALREERDLRAAALCFAIMDEAAIVLGEMGTQEFTLLPMASGVSIAADYPEDRA